MENKANFKVDPKLASLLGETYKSTEDAIKEMVDNAYDADAENVWITLPNPMTPEPEVVILDNGTGMKEMEIRHEYLRIASSRFSRKGEITTLKKRKVKGRKGIGKFAGLMIADIMMITSKTRGKSVSLAIDKNELAKAHYDLEKIDLPLTIIDCDPEEHGTIITLKGINQNFEFPNEDKLKEILVWDYGRSQDFIITVNGKITGIHDYKGKAYEKEIILEGNKKALLRYTITDKPVKSSGMLYRVGNKIVGRPKNLLKEDDIIPDKLKKRVIGEIICDDLEEYVTADWSSIVENSKLNQHIEDETSNELRISLNEVFTTEMNLAKARYQRRINQELEKLPEYRRSFAEKTLEKILAKFYGENDEKIETIISVMIDALEKDNYWSVIKNIEEAREGDVEKFANALTQFGLLEIGIISNQAINRLRFLDELQLLIESPGTLEGTMHKILEKNLWVLGNEHSLLFSNQTIEKAIQEILNKQYQGNRGSKRPDLFLGVNINREYHLIEFKKPDMTVGRKAESQALEYRDDLNSYFHNARITISIVGGKIDNTISSINERSDVKFLTYRQIISNAKVQLEWLIEELKRE